MAKNNIVLRIVTFFRTASKFIFEDMWRITGNDVSGLRRRLINLAKTIFISVRRFREDDLQSKASALTYSTLLAVVPALALMFAIAKGFGFQNIVQSQLFDYFPAQKEALAHALSFVDAYLTQAKSGVFVGIGIIFLLWTVISLMGTVESTLNDIWQVKKNRSFYRKITDYTSMFVLLPVLMIAPGQLEASSPAVSPRLLPPEVANRMMVFPVKSACSRKVRMMWGAVYHQIGKPRKIRS